jgi:hypothetical protein
MNRLATTQHNRKYLLGTVSAIALLTSIALAEPSVAESDGSSPQVWIELGGGLDQMDNAQSVYTPPFMAAPQSLRDFSISDTEKPTPLAFNFNGSITFQPDNSDWVLSASILYGRSQKRGHPMHAQPAQPCYHYPAYSFCIPVYAFADAVATNNESHAILDFKAGKDVGLGLLGKATSVISAGLRYAQFNSQMTAQMSSRPTNRRNNIDQFTASLNASRSFTGIGPSISWDASAPLVGNADAGMLSIDWGANVALLFGRQKTRAHHETVETYEHGYYGHPVIYDHPASPMREKTVTVPNLGGFAGLSLRYSDVKISLGYRADMFFSAVDAGIDTRKTYDRGFYGPFANISIGVGG